MGWRVRRRRHRLLVVRKNRRPSDVRVSVRVEVEEPCCHLLTRARARAYRQRRRGGIHHEKIRRGRRRKRKWIETTRSIVGNSPGTCRKGKRTRVAFIRERSTIGHPRNGKVNAEGGVPPVPRHNTIARDGRDVLLSDRPRQSTQPGPSHLAARRDVADLRQQVPQASQGEQVIPVPVQKALQSEAGEVHQSRRARQPRHLHPHLVKR